MVHIPACLPEASPLEVHRTLQASLDNYETFILGDFNIPNIDLGSNTVVETDQME